MEDDRCGADRALVDLTCRLEATSDHGCYYHAKVKRKLMDSSIEFGRGGSYRRPGSPYLQPAS